MRALLAVAVLLAAWPACAQQSSMTVANELGLMLSSEELCGLTFDQAAIEAYIEKNVAADDTSFAGLLAVMAGRAEEFSRMPASQKTAHCAQVRRSAAANGLVE
jgi:hypothetical protein